MAQYATSKTVKVAFVLDERGVEQCSAMFSEAFARADDDDTERPAVTLRIELPDGKLDDETVDGLLALSNLGKQRILGVSFSSHYRSSPRLSLEFNTEGYRSGIAYAIDGERVDGERVEAQVEQIIARAKQWYSPLARLDIVSVLLGGAFLFWLAASIVYFVLALAGHVSDEPSSPRDGALAQGFAIVLVVLLAALGVAGNRLRRWLFPVGVFALGERRNHPQHLSHWRWFLGGTVVFGFIVNIAAAIVVR